MRFKLLFPFLFLFLFVFSSFQIANSVIKVNYPRVFLSYVPDNVIVNFSEKVNPGVDKLYLTFQKKGRPYIFFREYSLSRDGKKAIFHVVLNSSGFYKVSVSVNGKNYNFYKRIYPGIISLIPSIFAILLAFFTKQVILSLFFGVICGSFFIYNFSLVHGFYRAIDTIMINALSVPDHLMIIIFSLMLGGMIGIISKSGGTQGIVDKITKYAKTSRSAQFIAWLMGILIFFDDYSNTLIVGNTLRPYTDKLRVSREKLSYIVDSTAAPVTSVALITTWVGTEVGLINDLHIKNLDGFQAFVRSVPYAFYAFFAIILVLIVILLNRDFGPMYKAELRARKEGKVVRDGAVTLADNSIYELTPPEGKPKRWINAFIPIMITIITILVGLYIDGYGNIPNPDRAPLRDILGNANSLKVLMWASFNGVIVAGLLALFQRILSLREVVDSWFVGMRSMMIAVIILTLAWSLTNVCLQLKTASYVAYLSKDYLSAMFIPALTFIMAAFIGFSTGTSWGTMGILVPIVVPIAYSLPIKQGLSPFHADQILYSTVGAILSGSVFGDHCSPISDTTIMSSMASGSDHLDHVQTQLPYSVVAAFIALFVGYIPIGYNFSALLSLFIGVLLLYSVVKIFGRELPIYTEKVN